MRKKKKKKHWRDDDRRTRRNMNDYYTISSKENYVHSGYTNMKDMFRKDKVHLTTGMREISENAKEVVADLLENVRQDWESLRRAFMEHSVAAEVIQSSNPDEFLREWNRFVEKKTGKRTLTRQLIEVKEMSMSMSRKRRAMESSKVEKTRTAAHKALEKEMNQNWKSLMDLLIKSTDFYEGERERYLKNRDGQDGIGKDSIYGDAKGDPSRLRTLGSFERMRKQTVDILESLGVESKDRTQIKAALGELRSNKEPSTEEKWKVLELVLDKAFAAASGLLIESSFDSDMDSPEMTRLIGEGFAEYKGETATKLAQDFTGDNVVGVFQFEGKETQVYASTKLTSSKDITRSYVVDQDIMKTGSFANSKSGRELKWLRRNMAALSAYSNHKDGLSDHVEKNYYWTEQNISIWMTIPRALDGAYNISEEVAGYLTGKGASNEQKRLHSVFYYHNGEFFWMVDILDTLIKGLRENKVEGVRENFVSGFKFTKSSLPVSRAKLIKHHEEKREIMKDLGLGRSIKYSDLNRHLGNKFSGEFSGWHPLHSVQIVLRLQKMLR